METLFWLAIGAFFVLGSRKALELGRLMREEEHRRNLVLRIAAFLAMSAWVHALPTILLTIYMRQHGMMAAELLSRNSPTMTAVSIYLLPLLLFLVAFPMLEPLAAYLERRPPRLRSGPVAIGALAYLSMLALIGATGGADSALMLFVLSGSIAAYFTFTIHASFEQVLKWFWLPLGVIALSTLALVLGEGAVEHLVGVQLKRFGVGGGRPARVMHDGKVFDGDLVLLTEETAYLSVGDATRHCLLRLPVQSSRIATMDARGHDFSHEGDLACAVSPQVAVSAASAGSAP